MKEHPILFNGEMVRAILDGRKTMTRRVVNSQSKSWRFCDLKTDLGYPASLGKTWAGFYLGADSESPGYFKCPYGVPGDRLWVRETFYECVDNNDIVRFAADGPAPTTETRHYRKRPSIFLLREDSRITLEVVAVRVERVQNITCVDAQSEGIVYQAGSYEMEMCSAGERDRRRVKDFETLWDSINAKRGYGWAVNPWVWVVEFKRVSP